MTDKLYIVRKRSGQWTVWSHEEVCLNFRSYDEAIETARSAAAVLSHEPRIDREAGCTARTGDRRGGHSSAVTSELARPGGAASPVS